MQSLLPVLAEFPINQVFSTFMMKTAKVRENLMNFLIQ